MPSLSIRDIIGPIMVGPSSSHTAGALRIAAMARRLCAAEPHTVHFCLLGSFAHTQAGHGTDRALVAGMLGLKADDLRIRGSFALADAAGMQVSFELAPEAEYDHPNTVDISITDVEGDTLSVRGTSVGGGVAVITEIDGLDVHITGEKTSIVVRQVDEQGVLAHISQSISDLGVNIATARMFRKRRGDVACTVLETDSAVSESLKPVLTAHPAIEDVRIIPGDISLTATTSRQAANSALKALAALDFPTAAALLMLCRQEGIALSEAMRRREEALVADTAFEGYLDRYLDEVLATMRAAALVPLKHPRPSIGGLIGGEAQKLYDAAARGDVFGDTVLARAAMLAIAVLETNASMGRIVAAPTAGASGVIPGVLFALQEAKGYTDADLKRALMGASAIGYVITRNATVSGAEGGCQAEVGSAAAMAAAAITELAGGTPQMCLDAAGNALSNLMGLVCDPVGGLVEVPCQKRNAAGAAVAFVSAQIALAGIGNLVDFDQTVEALRKVGRALPFELRESALGGLAATPAACGYCASCSPGKTCA